MNPSIADQIGQLGFGAASVGNLYRKVSDHDAYGTLNAVWNGDIRYFDTAPHYGLGLSERRLGAFLQNKPRDEFVVSTKVGRLLKPNPDYQGGRDLLNGFDVPDDLVRLFDPSADGIRRSLDASLERLGLDKVDILYLHDPDVYDLDRGLREGLPALTQLRDEGTVRAVGVGVNSVEAAVRAVREGDLDVVMLAGRFTLLEQPALAEFLPLCLERGVRVVAAAVFNSGLLATNDPTSIRRYNYSTAPESVVHRAEQIATVCAQFGVQLPEAAIQFPLRHPAVNTVVMAAARADYVHENIRRFHATVPEAMWATLEREGLL